jgi:YVTN family beta-propeller protein
VADGTGLYVGLFESSELARIAPDGRRLVWRVATGAGRTNGVAIDQGTVVTTNRERGTISLHAASDGNLVDVLKVGGLPWGVGAAAGRAYVANFADGTVSVVDLPTRSVVATVNTAPAPVAIAADEEGAWILHLGGQLWRLGRDGGIVRRLDAGVTGARGLALDSGRGRLYVGGDGELAALSLASLRMLWRIALPGPVHGLAVSPGTGRVFAVDPQNDLLYWTTPDGAVGGQIKLPAQGAADGGQGIAVLQDMVTVTGFQSGLLTLVRDPDCEHPAATATPTATSISAATVTLTATATPVPTATPSPRPATPAAIQAKIEIVWPHGGASVREAALANITAYLIAPAPAGAQTTTLESPPCDWAPTVRLWASLNNEPARPVALGQKRFVEAEGNRFPVWDFNDVDVSATRDLANRLAFFVTVDGVETRHNVWTHAADARTIFPQQDVPAGVVGALPAALDARIQIVWPHGGLPAEQAELANVTAAPFRRGTRLAIPPELGAGPSARLNWSLAADTQALGASAPGAPRVISTGPGGLRYLVWDFNDVDVSAAQDSLRPQYFWVTVEGADTQTSVWAHAVDARTVFPQPDLLSSCR